MEIALLIASLLATSSIAFAFYLFQKLTRIENDYENFKMLYVKDLAEMSSRIQGAKDFISGYDLEIKEFRKTIAEWDEVLNSDNVTRRIESLEASIGMKAFAADSFFVNRDKTRASK